VVLAKGIWIDLTTRNICGSVISDSFFSIPFFLFCRNYCSHRSHKLIRSIFWKNLFRSRRMTMSLERWNLIQNPRLVLIQWIDTRLTMCTK
jgi:hypothetical protein